MVSGWIIINDADADTLELAVEDWKLFGKTTPEMEDLPGDSRTAFDLGYRKRSLILVGVRFDSLVDIEDCLKLLNEWNNEGSFTIEIKVKSDDTEFKQDGVNTDLKYLYIDYSEIRKMAGGDIQQYRIGRIVFKQG